MWASLNAQETLCSSTHRHNTHMSRSSAVSNKAGGKTLVLYANQKSIGIATTPLSDMSACMLSPRQRGLRSMRRTKRKEGETLKAAALWESSRSYDNFNSNVCVCVSEKAACVRQSTLEIFTQGAMRMRKFSIVFQVSSFLPQGAWFQILLACT